MSERDTESIIRLLPPWDHISLKQRGRFPLVSAAAPLALHCSYCYYHRWIAWGLMYNKMMHFFNGKKRYIKMNMRSMYTVPSISIPFPNFRTSPRLSLVLSLTRAQCLLPVLGALKSGWETQRKNKMADSLPAHLVLQFSLH